jgi:peptidoglycan hydrolase CwlO-like protein
MTSKKDQKATAEEALAKMTKENGARGMSTEDAKAELDALTTQIENDTKYIAQVEKSLAEKKEEWKERSALRAGELEALSKAISILHSDDARDLMKKSFKSQGYSLVQSDSETSSQGIAAAAALRGVAAVASGAGRSRLLALAARASAPGHFKEVVKAIDDMVAVLKSEEEKDLEIKEDYEKTRAENARSAIKTSREMDEMTDAINQLEGQIKELAEQVAEKEQEIKDNKNELAEATRIRDDEHQEFLQKVKDDEAAHALIVSATEVLKNFYSENKLMLVQHHKAPGGPAGQAPPPPPATWEAPYGGKKAESTGVLAILAMVAEDVEKDLAVTKADESKSQAAYDETKKALEGSIADLEQNIVDMNANMADKQETIEETKGDRRRSKEELTALLDSMRKMAPGGDFFAVNYQVRRKNRQIELDGLYKAKAILEGATFSNVDENRELKPGDALLQRRK